MKIHVIYSIAHFNARNLFFRLNTYLLIDAKIWMKKKKQTKQNCKSAWRNQKDQTNGCSLLIFRFREIVFPLFQMAYVYRVGHHMNTIRINCSFVVAVVDKTVKIIELLFCCSVWPLFIGTRKQNKKIHHQFREENWPGSSRMFVNSKDELIKWEIQIDFRRLSFTSCHWRNRQRFFFSYSSHLNAVNIFILASFVSLWTEKFVLKFYFIIQ